MAKGFDNKTIECIDITRHLNFCVGNAVECVWKAGQNKDYKEGIEDCKKALQYLNDNGVNSEQPNRQTALAIFGLLIPPKEDDIEHLKFYTIYKILAGFSFDATTNITILMKEFKSKIKPKKKSVGIDKKVAVGTLKVGTKIIYKHCNYAVYTVSDKEVAICSSMGELDYIKPTIKVKINKENK